MKFTTSILPFLSLIPAITSIPVSDASTSPFSATQISTLSSSINDSLPSSNSPSPFVVGIYNVSFYSLNLPLETVKEILPSKYRDSILEINEDQTVKVILEAGHQSMNGPPGLGILNNEEAKLEIPGIGRVEESDVGFTYKVSLKKGLVQYFSFSPWPLPFTSFLLSLVTHLREQLRSCSFRSFSIWFNRHFRNHSSKGFIKRTNFRLFSQELHEHYKREDLRC